MVKANDDVRRDDDVRAADSDSRGLYPEDVSAREIEDDIEHTRAAMDDTISELFERLAPRNLLGEVLAIIRTGMNSRKARRRADQYDEDDEPGIGQRVARAAGRKAVETVKNHPLPSALITAGVVWMVLEEDRPTRKAKRRIERAIDRTFAARPSGVGYSEAYIEADVGGEMGARGPGYGRGGMGRGMHEARERMGEKAGAMRERVGEAAESMKHRASEAAERVGDWAHRTREHLADTGEYISERASDVSETVRERVADMGHAVKHGYQRTRRAYDRAIDDYPLLVGAAALGAGLLAGVLLPRTRTEDEYIGKASEEFKSRTRDMGRDVAERGADVAEHAVTAATTAATEAGKEMLGGESHEEDDKHEHEPARQHGERFRGTDI